MRIALWFTLLCLAVAFGCSQARAHSWYDMDCCSDADCWPMGTDRDAKEPDPKVVPGGYLTHDGVFVAEKDTRPSRDGRFHVCRYGGSLKAGVIVTRKGLCLYVPKPTF